MFNIEHIASYLELYLYIEQMISLFNVFGIYMNNEMKLILQDGSLYCYVYGLIGHMHIDICTEQVFF